MFFDWAFASAVRSGQRRGFFGFQFFWFDALQFSVSSKVFHSLEDILLLCMKKTIANQK